MRLFLFLIFLTVLATAAPAMADDALAPLGQTDPVRDMLGETKPVETLDEHITQYYDNCVAANKDASMKEYIETQCGCTTAEMSKFMTVKDMQALLKKGNETNFQMNRIMLLAYIPCMYNSVYDIVFDTCYYNKTTRALLRMDKKVCQCYAHAMGDFVAKQGPNIVPGFRQDKFNNEKSVPNPLGLILAQRYFENEGLSQYERCVAVVEKGLGQ